MKFFVDSANLTEIKKIKSDFLLDGVTTNPSLVAKSGEEQYKVIRAICEEVKGPVSAEVLSTDADGMYKEAHQLAGIHEQVVVKLPLTKEGLLTTRKLFLEEKIKTNLTLCFSALQALSAAKAGATMVSIFVGRLDDIGLKGMEIVDQVINMFAYYEFDTEILVASVRHSFHVLEAANLGADIVTIPPSLFPKLIEHPLTNIGLDQFLKSANLSQRK